MSEGEVRDGYTMLMALPRQPAGSVSTRLSESDPSGTQFAKGCVPFIPLQGSRWGSLVW